jgi:cytochrome c oxidase assembly protein subunit 15
MKSNSDSKSRFYRFAQFLLFYTLIVILWGAWVRISHSGDGCGDTWPLCHGQVIPDAQQNKTWVEFAHRIMSGLFGFLVIYLFWRGRKLFAHGEIIRRALLATLVFTITEALLGAKLVLFHLVGNNDSAFRLFAMSLHQINSMLLSGSVALVVLFAGPLPQSLQNLPPHSKAVKSKWSAGFLILFLGVAVTGGFAALASTLFPSSSLMSGFTEDFAPNAHYLLRLRISHPILATLIGGSLSLYFWLRAQQESQRILRQALVAVSLMFAAGVVFGYLTLFSLAPVWMKIVHLLLAHLIWITLLRWFALRKIAR